VDRLADQIPGPIGLPTFGDGLGVIRFDEEAWTTAGMMPSENNPGIREAHPVTFVSSDQVFGPIEANFGCNS
jgi:hypothetical protein